MIKLKDGIDPSVLRPFGFQTKEEVNSECEANGTCFDVSEDGYYKFLRYDEDDPNAGQIIYDGYSYNANVCMHFRPNRKLWVEVTPIGTYHLEGRELDVVTDTIFDLVTAGIVEIV